MRRPLFAAAGSIALALTLATPGAYATVPTTVLTSFDVEQGYGRITVPKACATGVESSDRSPATVGGPADPLASSAPATSWGVDPAGATGTEYSVFFHSGAPAVASVDVEGGTSGHVRVVAYVWTANTSAARHVWTAAAPVTGAAGSWARVDAATMSLTWHDDDGDPSFTGTIDEFDAAHPQFNGAATDHLVWIGFGCDGQAFHFQHVVSGSTGSTAVEDLGRLVNSAFAHGDPRLVIAGGRASIRALFTYSAGPTATIQFRSLPDGEWHYGSLAVPQIPLGDQPCVTVPADDYGFSGMDCNVYSQSRATAPLLYNTQLLVSYPGTSGVTATQSAPDIVFVRPKITATVPTFIYAGHNFVVRGSTYPAKPGTVVRLYAAHGSHRVLVGTATVSSTGAFKVVGSVPWRTSWSLWIVSAPDASNAPGNSGHALRTAH